MADRCGQIGELLQHLFELRDADVFVSDWSRPYMELDPFPLRHDHFI